MSQMEILKIEIRSAQNVGKVWIRRNKILLAPFGVIPGNFSHGPKNQKNEILKIKIRSAQNVGKVWISRKQILLAPFGAI